MNLIKHFGYCVIPAGTRLYRMGEINQDHGSYFALYPDWAIGHSTNEEKQVGVWLTKQEIKVLFLFSKLSFYGLPISALEQLFKVTTGQNHEQLNIKWRNWRLKNQLCRTLSKHKMIGWLSSQEDTPPLEIFLLPKVCHSGLIFEKTYDGGNVKNSLRFLKLFPPEKFWIKTNANLKNSLEYLLNRRFQEKYYSLFEFFYKGKPS